jgi:lipopolysaccharide transport system permease protein
MQRLHEYLELIFWKAMAELQAEAARAYIGILWWVAEPALYMLAFYTAFGLGLRGGGEQAVFFLLCGLVPWKWFTSGVQNGSGSIQANSGLIQQVYLPKLILPLVSIFTNTIKFIIVLTILMLILTAFGHGPDVTWFGLPVVIAVELLLIVAAGSLAASILPIFPDIKLVVDNGLMVLMFVSGVFFDMSRLPPQAVLRYNPLIPILEGFRAPLLRHEWPDWQALSWVTVAAIAMYAVAIRILVAYDRRYIKLMIA